MLKLENNKSIMEAQELMVWTDSNPKNQARIKTIR